MVSKEVKKIQSRLTDVKKSESDGFGFSPLNPSNFGFGFDIVQQL